MLKPLAVPAIRRVSLQFPNGPLTPQWNLTSPFCHPNYRRAESLTSKHSALYNTAAMSHGQILKSKESNSMKLKIQFLDSSVETSSSGASRISSAQNQTWPVAVVFHCYKVTGSSTGTFLWRTSQVHSCHVALSLASLSLGQMEHIFVALWNSCSSFFSVRWGWNPRLLAC